MTIRMPSWALILFATALFAGGAWLFGTAPTVQAQAVPVGPEWQITVVSQFDGDGDPQDQQPYLYNAYTGRVYRIWSKCGGKKAKTTKDGVSGCLSPMPVLAGSDGNSLPLYTPNR